jgi:hypothetical protein
MARISLFSPLEGDYGSRSAELARQQKLAQMLTEMSQQEMPVSTAGGITAPVSPYGALAKALTSFGGSYLSGKSAADEAALKKSDQEMAQKALENIYVMPAGSRQPNVGMVDTKGIEGAVPSFAVTGRTNIEDTATTPQQQLQMLTPLMQGGETSRSVYNAFMPQVMQQRNADIARQQKLSDDEAERNRKLAEAEAERKRVSSQEQFLAKPTNISQERWDSAAKVPGLRTQLFQNNAVEKRSEFSQELIDAGFTPGTPAFNAEMAKKLRRETYIAPVSAPSSGTPQTYIVDGKPFFGTPQDALNLARSGKNVLPYSQTTAGKPVPTRLADELKTHGAALDSAMTLNSEFKPEYTNQGFMGVGGDKAIALKKIYGSNDPAVSWWTTYNEKAGQIRNKMYGASLTPAEIEEWLKIAVNPNMDATTIQNNLRRQQEIEERAVSRDVNGALASGYTSESVEGYLGYPVDRFKKIPPPVINIPEVPASLRGKSLDYNPQTKQWRDRETKKNFDLSGRPL